MAGDTGTTTGATGTGGERHESPPVPYRLRVHRMLSALAVLIGVALMVYMIYAESEPGAIPLLVATLGIGWYVITQNKIRSSTIEPKNTPPHHHN